MEEQPTKSDKPQIQAGCAACGLRKKAEEKPKSLIAKFWRWHTTWCPGWKAYQAELAKQKPLDTRG
jgi:hypothetical protein